MDVYLIKTLLLNLWDWYLRFSHLSFAWYYGWLVEYWPTSAILHERGIWHARFCTWGDFLLTAAASHAGCVLLSDQFVTPSQNLVYIFFHFLYEKDRWGASLHAGKVISVFMEVFEVTFAWPPEYLKVSLFFLVLWQI